MKKLFLGMFIMLSANLFASEPMLEATPFAVVAQQIGKGKAVLIEVGSDRCRSCQIMGRLLYKVKGAHPEYPIYFVNVAKERHAALLLKIQMIPTQIVFDAKGHEAYRHVGVLRPQELDALVYRYLMKEKQ